MIRDRFEELADCLLLGLFVTVVALPVVTAPSGFAAACTVARSGGSPFAELRARWRTPGQELAAGVVCAIIGLDVLLALTVLPGGPVLRVAVLIACTAVGALVLAIAARAGITRSDWRAALRWEAPKPMLMAVLVVAGVLVWSLPPLAMVIGGPLALAAVR